MDVRTGTLRWPTRTGVGQRSGGSCFCFIIVSKCNEYTVVNFQMYTAELYYQSIRILVIWHD